MHILFSAILISQNSKVNTGVTVSFLIKLQLHLKKVLQRNCIKKGLYHRWFPVNFANFLRTPFFYRIPLAATGRCFALNFLTFFRTSFSQNTFLRRLFYSVVQMISLLHLCLSNSVKSTSVKILVMEVACHQIFFTAS